MVLEENGDYKEKQYLLTDHLGSPEVVLDENFTVVERLSFDPWGQRDSVDSALPISSVTSVSAIGYTGHEMDDELSLVNMNARIYDPVVGRFLSPDSMVPDPSDLQSFNRYSYVHNNPLRYTDSTGHEIDDTDGGIGEMGGYGNEDNPNGNDGEGEFGEDAPDYDGDGVPDPLYGAGTSPHRASVQSTDPTPTKQANQKSKYGVASSYAALAFGVYDVSYAGTIEFAKIGETMVDKKTGLQMAVFESRTSDLSVVAYAGTNDLKDFVADVLQAFGLPSAQYNKAIDIGYREYLRTGGTVHFVGHSLGGGLATAASIMTGSKATVFNAAAVHSNTVNGLSPVKDSITHYYSAGDALQIINFLTPARLYGRQVSLGWAGIHSMRAACQAMECN